MDRIELVEIRVGPATIIEVYAEQVESAGSRQLREDTMARLRRAYLRERSHTRRRRGRRAMYGLFSGLALGATGLAALVWLLHGL